MDIEKFVFFYVVIVTVYIFWTLESKVFKTEAENEKLKKEIEKLKTNMGD